MNKKEYSVTELNALRSAVEEKWLFGSYNGPTRSRVSRSYKEEVKTASVEEMVRTHILAGHTAEDLYASENQPADGNTYI